MHVTLKCEGCVVLFFPSTKVIFIPLGFCYLARFLMRQHGKHHLVVTGTRGSVEEKHYCVPCQTRTLSIGYPSRIWIRYFLHQYGLYLVFLYI